MKKSHIFVLAVVFIIPAILCFFGFVVLSFVFTGKEICTTQLDNGYSIRVNYTTFNIDAPPSHSLYIKGKSDWVYVDYSVTMLQIRSKLGIIDLEQTNKAYCESISMSLRTNNDYINKGKYVLIGDAISLDGGKTFIREHREAFPVLFEKHKAKLINEYNISTLKYRDEFLVIDFIPVSYTLETDKMLVTVTQNEVTVSTSPAIIVFEHSGDSWKIAEVGGKRFE
jgi:hypothetical protein